MIIKSVLYTLCALVMNGWAINQPFFPTADG